MPILSCDIEVEKVSGYTGLSHYRNEGRPRWCTCTVRRDTKISDVRPGRQNKAKQSGCSRHDIAWHGGVETQSKYTCDEPLFRTRSTYSQTQNKFNLRNARNNCRKGRCLAQKSLRFLVDFVGNHDPNVGRMTILVPSITIWK